MSALNKSATINTQSIWLDCSCTVHVYTYKMNAPEFVNNTRNHEGCKHVTNELAGLQKEGVVVW